MLFKHQHLLEELRKNGRQATAEIVHVQTLGGGSNLRAAWAADDDLSSGWMDCRMNLRVFPGHGEPPFEATVMTRIHTLKLQGGSVPVWYDPQDHSRVVVDYEADLAAETHNMANLDRLTHRHDQRLGLAWTPVGRGLLPIEVLGRQGKGHLKVDGKLGKVLSEPAEAAAGYVRGRSAELAPELPSDWFARNDIHISVAWGENDLPGIPREDWADAGLAVVAALVSLVSGRIVRPEVALTGGVSPAGDLLPVRGISEKAQAAKREHAQRLVLPAANQEDARHVPQAQHRDLEFYYAATINEAIGGALAKAHHRH